MSQPHKFAAVFREFASIDAAAGVIRGVSVITEGEAKGHGMAIDRTTLEQVRTCALSYKGGLKVKMTHAGDAGDIVGFLTDFRIDGAKLLADLHLLESSPHRAYILELAAKIPDTFGLSISFSGPVEKRDDISFARCVEIYSADLVAEPAANPSGLFSTPASAPAPAGQPQPVTHMEDKKPVDPMAELKALIEGLSARLSKLENPEAKKPEGSEQEMSAKLNQVAELAAQSALKAFAAQFGTPPAPASAANDTGANGKPAVKKFEELVREHPEYSKNKKAAIAALVKSHPKEYADYNTRCRSGEVIMF